jgi:hypothetical protein
MNYICFCGEQATLIEDDKLYCQDHLPWEYNMNYEIMKFLNKDKDIFPLEPQTIRRN